MRLFFLGTLIPQLVCDAVNLVDPDKVVVCTQPRRVAAITLAEYVSKDRGQSLADDVLNLLQQH